MDSGYLQYIVKNLLKDFNLYLVRNNKKLSNSFNFRNLFLNSWSIADVLLSQKE